MNAPIEAHLQLFREYARNPVRTIQGADDMLRGFLAMAREAAELCVNIRPSNPNMRDDLERLELLALDIKTATVRAHRLPRDRS